MSTTNDQPTPPPASPLDQLTARQAALGQQLAQAQAQAQYHEHEAAVARTNRDQIMAALLELSGLVQALQGGNSG